VQTSTEGNVIPSPPSETGHAASAETNDHFVRQIARILVLIFGLIFGMFYLYQVGHTVWTQHWVVEVGQKHFVATVLIPFAAFSALCVVVILEIDAGRIEIHGFGITFSGAAGPIIMWIFCFLAVVIAVRLVWSLE
jgi:hypothetical protein